MITTRTRSTFKQGLKLFVFLIAILALAPASWSQGVASVSGRAVDASGSSIPNATVTVRSVETGAARTTSTDDNGAYRTLSLPVGKYDVKVEKNGFKSEVRQGIDLVVGQEAIVNFTLDVGAVSQELTVTAEAPVVNTTTAQTSGLVSEQEVKELPLNGRSFDNLILLDAGTMNFRSMHSTSNAVSGGLGNLFSISGRRTDQNMFLLNGVIYEGNGGQVDSPGSVSGQLLGIDAVREFNVLSDNYSAEYGKRSGGQISIVTMSGTNQLHGSIFDFLRNSDFDARNFFDPSPTLIGARIPHFERNNFGGSLGGPIRKDKTFLFGNYEGFRQHLGLSNLAYVPDTEARLGFLPTGKDGALVNVGLGAGMAPYLAIWPTQNGPEVGGGVAEYFNSPLQTIREDFGTARIDQTFSAKDSLSGVYTIDDGTSLTPQVTNTFATNLVYRAQVASLSEVHVFSPSFLNTLTVGYSRARFLTVDIPVANIPASLSLQQGFPLGALKVGASGGTSSQTLSQVGSGGTSYSARNLFTEADNVQIIRGKHLFGFGVWFQQVEDNALESFALGATSFPSLMSLVQGKMQSFSGSLFSIPQDFRVHEGAWYAEDTIKITPKLTLTAGVRHEFTDGWQEANGKIANYLMNGTFPTGVFQSQATVERQLFTKNNARFLFMPRIGLAWSPFASGKTAVHAGFGLYYNLLDNLAFNTSKNPPLTDTIALPAGPFPFPQLSPNSPIPGALPTLQAWPSDPKTPAVLAYNLKVEQALFGNLALSVAYSGSHGYHLLTQPDANSVYPLVCGGAQLYPASDFPAAAACPTGINTLPPGTLYYGYAGAVRRNPNLSESGLFVTQATSHYNAMLVELTERLKKGLSFKANYTWGRSLDDSSEIVAYQGGSPMPLNPENLMFDYGPSIYDITNRFSFSGSYELPFGKGRAIGNSLNGVLDRIVGGWQVNSIVSIQSGLPFSPELGFNRSANGNIKNPDRPSWNPNFTGTLYPKTPNKWVDPEAFILEPAGTYGNTSRDSLRQPGLSEVDLSFLKIIPLTERMKLQFRAEGFNIFNHPNFGLPINTMRNPDGSLQLTAGRISSTTTSSRQIQFGLKLLW